MNRVSLSVETKKPFKVKETIFGTFTTFINTPSKILEFRIKFLGFEMIQWNKDVEESNAFLKCKYEKKVKSRTIMERLLHVREEVEFKVGTDEYKFQIRLPELLPSSLESQYGTIRYVLSARILVQTKTGERFYIQASSKIPIRGQMIHDSFIHQRIPRQITAKKSFLFTQKHLLVELHLDSKIFKTGDIVTGWYRIINESQKEITKIQLSIRQKFWIFHQQMLSRTDEFVISNLELLPFVKEQNFSLIVPDNLPETIPKKFIQFSTVGKIFQITYRIKMKIEFKYAMPLRISVPIILIKNEQEGNLREVPANASAPPLEFVAQPTFVDLK